MSRKRPDRLYHYTTPEGLLGILSTQSIHATSFSFLNDSSEIFYALDLLESVAPHRTLPKDPLKRPVAKPGSPDWLVQLTAALLATSAELFVACFSELADDLSQWRGYGLPSVDRYCIGFDVTAMAELETDLPGSGAQARLHRIIYDEPRQRKLLEATVETIRKQRNTDIGCLIDALTSIKNPSFRNEREWRISAVMFGQDNSAVSFSIREHTVKPHTLLRMNDGARLPIKEVLVLPAGHPSRALKATTMLLAKHGYERSIARLSTVPLVG